MFCIIPINAVLPEQSSVYKGLYDHVNSGYLAGKCVIGGRGGEPVF